MKTFCITTGSEWELAVAEFERVGIHVESFKAIVEENRILAFNKSVYECMKLAEGDSLLLFEDDVCFDLNTFYEIIFPLDALTVHLGCNIIGNNIMNWKMPTKSNVKGFAKLHNCWQSHATWYNKECVAYILENFKYVTKKYEAECQIFDEWLRTNVLNQGYSYVLSPMIAYQRPRYSEIWKTQVDYTEIHRQGNQWLKENL